LAGKIEISENDLTFKYSRSSGPGGQNVNKVSTKVTVFFDLAKCTAFSEAHKNQIRESLKSRIDKAGLLTVISQKYRTQNANRRAAVEKLKQLLEQAMKEKPVRRKTRLPQWARQKRLEKKKHRSTIKHLRQEKIFNY